MHTIAIGLHIVYRHKALNIISLFFFVWHMSVIKLYWNMSYLVGQLMSYRCSNVFLIHWGGNSVHKQKSWLTVSYQSPVFHRTCCMVRQGNLICNQWRQKSGGKVMSFKCQCFAFIFTLSSSWTLHSNNIYSELEDMFIKLWSHHCVMAFSIVFALSVQLDGHWPSLPTGYATSNSLS